MYYIQKIVKSRDQYTVTIPKKLAEESGLDKARIVEIWKTEKNIIHIKEYDGKKRVKPKISRSRAKQD